jgi:hypothetical protein
MLGPEGVSRALVTRLVEQYPLAVSGFRRRYNADPLDIPHIVRVFPAERDTATIESFPAVFVTETETTGRLDTRRVDSDGERDVYEYRYRKRIFLFVTGDSTDQVDLLRKRLVLATREILLTNKILFDDGEQYIAVDGNTVKESFSDTVADNSGQFFSGAYLELDVTTEETLAAWPAPYGAAEEFVVVIDPTPTLVEFPIVEDDAGQGDIVPFPPEYA